MVFRTCRNILIINCTICTCNISFELAKMDAQSFTFRLRTQLPCLLC